MKKKYSTPEIEIYKYSEINVITTSGEGEPVNPLPDPWSAKSNGPDLFK